MRSRLLLLAMPLALVACPETNPDDFPGPATACADFSTPQGYVDALQCSDYQSCELDCSCSEPAKPYACPAMQPWAAMAHAACAGFDGVTFPDLVNGKCKSALPTNAALQTIGLDANVAGRWHLPDGHFVQPAGHDQIVHGADVTSSFLTDAMLVPGTSFAVLVDAGVIDDALYCVDLDLLSQDVPALVSDVRFAAPERLDRGLAFAAPNEVYVSGAANGKLFAFTIDLQSGALARDDAKDVDLGAGYYAGSLATTADPNVIVVAPQTGASDVRVVNLAAKTWTSMTASPSQEFFGLFPDPNDTTQNTLWLASYDTASLLRFDLSKQFVTATYPTGKNPEGIAITPNHVMVANSDDDTISVFDASGNTAQTLSMKSDGLGGAQPSALVFDATLSRVYATLSGINAIDVYAYNAAATAPLAPLGRIPTSWFPTSLLLRADGSLVVTTAKGHGSGPSTNASIAPDLGKGSIALVSPPSLDDLDALSTTVVESRRNATESGFPTVTCPSIATDFPVPVFNTIGPSPSIQYVVYIVRESKTFDALFGDLPSVDGDAQNVLFPGRMDEIFANARGLAKQFSNFDHYGTDADQTIQGHVWSAFGRTTDYIERVSAATTNGARPPRLGLDPVYGSPSEGSLFAWADRNAIPYQDMGEIVGVGARSVDPKFPGLLLSQTVPDTEKACYIAARARALCDLAPLTYVVLPNDKTLGTTPGAPSPDTMLASNDVATGMIVDAISHSPFWPNTLIIVTEDDAQMGEDHVDAHRAPLFMASPWVQHGYVSHTAIGVASIHKMLAHIFGKPYQSESVADAAIPFDAFTSTPDYTPYVFSPLETEVSCNPAKP